MLAILFLSKKALGETVFLQINHNKPRPVLLICVSLCLFNFFFLKWLRNTCNIYLDGQNYMKLFSLGLNTKKKFFN